MKQFQKASEIPPNCIVAPTAYFAHRPGAKPSGAYGGHEFYERTDVSELLTVGEWRQRRRSIKAGETPLALRGADLTGVYADWQTE